MKRITETQKHRIVALFLTGTPMRALAEVWDVEVEKIEQIVRVAMTAMEVQRGCL